MQHGHLLEQIIANFNSLFFMNDFVFLNPKYFRDENEKELCDLLLILNDECIVISVKGTDGRYRSDSKLQNWLVKKTWEGSKQAKGGINWLKNGACQNFCVKIYVIQVKQAVLPSSHFYVNSFSCLRVFPNCPDLSAYVVFIQCYLLLSIVTTLQRVSGLPLMRIIPIPASI